MTSSPVHEVPLEEIEMLRVQLANERVVSAREAVGAAAMLQQMRQAEYESLVKTLTDKYRVQAEGLELKGFNLQKQTLIFGPKAPEQKKVGE